MAGYPKDYEKHEEISDYMRLQKEGDYRIRILRDPILGYETWEESVDDNGQKKNTPHRARTFQECVGMPSKDGKIKEFHAFIVWDYQTKTVRLLNVTQKYKEEIYDYNIDEDWGDFSKYDLVIKRTGLTFSDTEYSVRPIPHKPMADEIKKAFKQITIEEELYFTGGHPIVREDSLADDVAEALGDNEPEKSEAKLAEKDLDDDISESIPF